MEAQLPQFPPYHTVQLMAKGGMAEVFRAVRVGAAHEVVEVAVKRLRPELANDRTQVDMFLAEGRWGSLFDHPNLVPVLACRESLAGHIQILPYLDGVNLDELLAARRKPFHWRVAVHVAQQMASALAYAHALHDTDGQHVGLIHRDVSPSNVMITRTGLVKLIDFGVSKTSLAMPQVTTAGEIKGKLGYMSPEHIDGLKLDSRTDQFSLGVVLYEMLVGARLFSNKEGLASTRRRRRAPQPPPSLHVSSIPKDLDAVVLRLLAGLPDERFDTCAAVVDELQAVVERHGDGPVSLEGQAQCTLDWTRLRGPDPTVRDRVAQ